MCGFRLQLPPSSVHKRCFQLEPIILGWDCQSWRRRDGTRWGKQRKKRLVLGTPDGKEGYGSLQFKQGEKLICSPSLQPVAKVRLEAPLPGCLGSRSQNSMGDSAWPCCRNHLLQGKQIHCHLEFLQKFASLIPFNSGSWPRTACLLHAIFEFVCVSVCKNYWYTYLQMVCKNYTSLEWVPTEKHFCHGLRFFLSV